MSDPNFQNLNDGQISESSMTGYDQRLYNQTSNDSPQSKQSSNFSLGSNQSPKRGSTVLNTSVEEGGKRFLRKNKPGRLQLDLVQPSDAVDSNVREGIHVISDKDQNALFQILFKLKNRENQNNIHTVLSEERRINLNFLEITDCVVNAGIVMLFEEGVQVLKVRRCEAKDEFAERLAETKFPALNKLDLSYNLIQRLPNFDCPYLTCLNLAHNRIERIDVNNLVGVSLLEELNLGHNQLKFQPKEFKELIMNIGTVLPKLERLSFEGNPFCAGMDYYEHVILLELVDRLEYLNGRPIDREGFKTNYNQIRMQVHALENRDQSYLNGKLRTPCHFALLTDAIDKCNENPSQLLSSLNDLKLLVDNLVKKSQVDSCVFRYELKNNENTLTQDVRDFLEKAERLVEKEEHANTILFDILAKLSLVQQDNLDLSYMVFGKLLDLMKRSDNLCEIILQSIKNECISSFCGSSLDQLNFNRLKQMNEIFSLAPKPSELVHPSFALSMEKWLLQLLERDLSFGLELPEYLILANFYSLNICIASPNARVHALLQQLFAHFLSFKHHSESNGSELLSVFVFGVKVVKVWLLVERRRGSLQRAALNIPSTDSSRSAAPFIEMVTGPKYVSSLSSSDPASGSTLTLESRVPLFLLEKSYFLGIIEQTWNFLSMVLDHSTGSQKSLQQRSQMEILNCLLGILAELLTYSPFVALDTEPFTFTNGVNLFVQIFSELNKKMTKKLQFLSIIYNFAFKILNNR